MKKFKFEVGEKFGDFEIVDNISTVKNGHTYVTVICKCGKVQLSCLSDLKNGNITKCQSCKARERSRKVKIGDKFKCWTIIGGPKSNKHQCLLWEVQCDCKETTKWVQANELMNPNKHFKCQKCAAIDRGEIQAINNGKIGELKLTQYTRIKRSAEKRNIEFNVSLEDLWNLFISQKQICAITGDFIETINSASLDRIDSTLWYINGNVQWVTYQANVSKHIMNMSELYEFCKKVLKYADQQPSQPLKKLEGSETND